jgi:ssDNA-binding Zn-finger/Zn-ribbon topoisomerase 1
MGLKCSVIGHKYGEASVEREREEQGSEVVITIREEETCERCGKTRIVSENKEVTSIETPSDIAGGMVEDGESETAESAAEEDAAAADDEPPATGTDDGVKPDVETEVEAVDPEDDDAEILDAEAESGGDSELDDPSTVESVTDTDDEEAAATDEAVNTDPEEDDGIIIDGDDEDRAGDDEREPGAWPEEPDKGDDDWTPMTETAAEEGTDEESTPDVEPLGGSAVTVPDGQFRCPECDFTTDVEASSLRAGDFCPECHKGALVKSTE